MIAVDTNVLARIITEDDPDQARRALDTLERKPAIFVSKTVLLELAWILRASYHFERQSILEVFHDVLRVGNFDIEDEAAVRRAVEFFGKGLDFADSLHLASAGERRFVTFDRRLQRAARRLALGDVSEP